MRLAWTALLILLTSCTMLRGEAVNPDLKHLYAEARWSELRRALAHDREHALYNGAVAAAFNDLPSAEVLLRSVIRRAPQSEAARDAYRVLANAYLDTGMYQRFTAAMDQKWISFPDKVESSRERNEFA